MTESQRLTLIEERYAHLQQHLLEQDKAMLGFSEELAKLRREIARLRAQSGGDPRENDQAADERPPHY